MNKRVELEGTIDVYKPDVILVTEYAPKNCAEPTADSELQIEGYSLFTNSQKYKRGCLIYTRTELGASPSMVSDMCSFDENCWCEISLANSDRLLLGCIYRSPNSPNENNDKMRKELTEITNRKSFSHILICGDFNYPGINWEKETSTNKKEKEFIETSRDCFLHQNVLHPTHFRPEQQSNTLDLIFTNEEGMISKVEHNAPLGKSHHSILTFSVECYKQKTKFIPTYMYNKADFEGMRASLQEIDWQEAMRDSSCEEAWQTFSVKLEEITAKHVPKTKPPPTKTKTKKPPWVTDELTKKIKEKQKLFRKYMKTRQSEDQKSYSRARNQVRWKCRQEAKRHEISIAEEAKTSPKGVFNYAKRKMKTKTGIADLTKEDGTLASSSEEKANVLNDFFSSVFTLEDTTHMPATPEPTPMKPITSIRITESEVRKRLDKLNPTKATGPDGIPPRLLQELSEDLAGPLTVIMNKSMEEGKIPEIWKKANVVPIFKKGKKNVPGNYRPVSLTCVLCKVMEAIVREQIVDHLKLNNLISEAQHGFIGGRSCSTNLMTAMEDWTDALEKGEATDIIYLDFAKAFDTVPHERLIHKLSNLGIQGHALGWIKSFLSGRTQKVVVDGEESGWRDVISGIPQGSVLGPMLFVCFVNDLPDDIKSSALLFADDTKLYSTVPKNHDQIQEDLNKMQEWSEEWQLRFNASKCKVMHLGKQANPESYKMSGNGGEVELEETEMEKDLGVNVDNKLAFDEHINIQTKKASKLLAMIRRTFDHLDEKILPLLYTAIIRPHLEYCNTIWHPAWKKDKEKLESIQRRATKMVPSMRDKPYEERLKHLGIPSLYYRRARGDMIECYKYLTGIYKVPTNFLPLDTSRATRGHNLKLRKQAAKKQVKSNAFSRRVVNDWNALPEKVISAPTLNCFKARLDNAWKDFRYCAHSNWTKSPTPTHAKLVVKSSAKCARVYQPAERTS